METAIILDVLPATRGDALWLECQRPGQRPWRLLIDGGLPTDYPQLRKHLRKVVPGGPVDIDLVVVSHIDSDHIGGLLGLLADPTLDLRLGDLWFNGLPQLPEEQDHQKRSVAQGEQLMALLDGGGGKNWPWNECFGRGAVMTAGDGAFHTVTWPDGPVLTLLSPTPRRLIDLRKTWAAELLKLQRGLPSDEIPPSAPQVLDDLETLAAQDFKKLDASVTNGSSIAFLIEYAGRRLLFAADAFSSVMGSALTSLANSGDGRPISLDVFKLPHHGSKGNVTVSLLDLVPARHYVVSTNGDRFNHPDDVALARVVTRARAAGRPVKLWFNYAGAAAQRWSRPDLQERYDYICCSPADEASPGIRLELPWERDAGGVP